MSLMLVVGGRVALRGFREEDAGAVDALYGEVVQAAGISHVRPLHLAGHVSRSAEGGRFAVLEADGALVIERLGDPGPIGIVEFDVSDRLLAIKFIALAKANRGWGYGSEAVRLLEEEAIRGAIAQRFRAEVDLRNGLGLYFWLRLGYRPDAGSAGVLPMVRELR